MTVAADGRVLYVTADKFVSYNPTTENKGMLLHNKPTVVPLLEPCTDQATAVPTHVLHRYSFHISLVFTAQLQNNIVNDNPSRGI